MKEKRLHLEDLNFIAGFFFKRVGGDREEFGKQPKYRQIRNTLFAMQQGFAPQIGALASYIPVALKKSYTDSSQIFIDTN